MACGLPVIATKNSGGMDIIKDGEDGYIIDIRDSSQIRQKIYTLYCDKKLLSTLSVNSYRNARKNHGWDKYGDRAISIYKNILSKQHMIST